MSNTKLMSDQLMALVYDPPWSLIEEVHGNDKILNQAVLERPLIMAQYRVQCAHLVQLYKDAKATQETLTQEAEKTYRMAELLNIIYQHMHEPDDVERMRRDKAILHNFLAHHLPPEQHPNTIPVPKPKPGINSHIRQFVLNTNMNRLLAIRVRRLILAALAFELFAAFRAWVNTIEYVTNPFFLYLGWMFFVPRLMANIIALAKHLVPNPWMTAEERRLPWMTRLRAYLNLHRRVFELSNDIAWFTGGFLACFLCVGPLLPLRAMIMVAVQISDLVVICIRSFMELERLYTLKKKYHEGCADGTLTPNPSYLKALDERIEHEKRVSYLGITNNMLLVLSIITLLPAVAALHPLLPVLGAILSVLTTLRFMHGTSVLEKNQPAINLQPLATPRFFKPGPASTPQPLQEKKEELEPFFNHLHPQYF